MGTEKKTNKRTESDILSATGTPIKLGGRDYILTPKPRGKARLVRKRMGGLLEELQGASGLISAAMSEKVESLGSDQVEAALPLLSTILGPRMDELLDLVYEYEPTIAADRAWLEGEEVDGEGATDADFVQAIIVIVGFCFGPLSQMAGQMSMTMTTSQTQGNSGDSGAS